MWQATAAGASAVYARVMCRHDVMTQSPQILNRTDSR